MRNSGFGLAVAVALAAWGGAGGAMAADDLAAAGQKVFEARCKACHSAEAGGGKRYDPGPNLFGVFGRKAGMVDGFRFSKAHRTCGVVWNETTLDAYLQNVEMVVPGTIKRFAGLEDAADRKAVIAYLRSLK